jgi:nicotinamidase/pyrazinamidase
MFEMMRDRLNCALLGIARSMPLAVLLALAACEQADSGRDGEPATSGRSALIIVDMQYDFMPGGALAAPGGDEIIPLINQLQSSFDVVVATQDWHPPDHGSFASVHPGRAPGEVIELNGLDQVLWPDHAVQGTHGAELADSLDRSRIQRVFRKGTNPEIDSYSGFFDNGRQSDTGLNDYLQSEGVTDVFVVGLALDYCVYYTALDAQHLGYRTTVLTDATRAVNLEPTDAADAVDGMREQGVRIAESADL